MLKYKTKILIIVGFDFNWKEDISQQLLIAHFLNKDVKKKIIQLTKRLSNTWLDQTNMMCLKNNYLKCFVRKY